MPKYSVTCACGQVVTVSCDTVPCAEVAARESFVLVKCGDGSQRCKNAVWFDATEGKEKRVVDAKATV